MVAAWKPALDVGRSPAVDPRGWPVLRPARPDGHRGADPGQGPARPRSTRRRRRSRPTSSPTTPSDLRLTRRGRADRARPGRPDARDPRSTPPLEDADEPRTTRDGRPTRRSRSRRRTRPAAPQLRPQLVRVGDGAADRARARRADPLPAGPGHLPVLHQPHRGQPAGGHLHQDPRRRRGPASRTRTQASSSASTTTSTSSPASVGDFWQWFTNTLVWTAACVVFHYTIGLGLAVHAQPRRSAAAGSTGCC